MSEEFEEIDIIDLSEKKKDRAKDKSAKLKAKEEKQKRIEVRKRNNMRYNSLLDRITETLNKNHPDLGKTLLNSAETTRIYYRSINVYRKGPQKIVVANIVELCRQMGRHPEHVMNFILEEIEVSGCMTISGFLIHAAIRVKGVNELFSKFVAVYVLCSVCRRHNTELIRDKKMRLWNLYCYSCQSNRSVKAIKGIEKKFSDYEPLLKVQEW